VLKVDIMKVFNDFHARGMFKKCLIAAFISLIQKKSGAIDIKDFQPISLVGGVYKIIVKVLTNKLKFVLEKIIPIPHNAFFEDR
jgi:hypothetical protein